MYLQHRNVSKRTVNLNINRELGPWTNTSDWLRVKLEYQCSPKNNKLYKQQEHQYTVHAYQRNSRRWTRSQTRVKLFVTTPLETIQTLPADNTPVDGIKNEELISITSITLIQKIGRNDNPVHGNSMLKVFRSGNSNLLVILNYTRPTSYIQY